jgi:hypothetical protein
MAGATETTERVEADVEPAAPPRWRRIVVWVVVVAIAGAVAFGVATAVHLGVARSSFGALMAGLGLVVVAVAVAATDAHRRGVLRVALLALALAGLGCWWATFVGFSHDVAISTSRHRTRVQIGGSNCEGDPIAVAIGRATGVGWTNEFSIDGGVLNEWDSAPLPAGHAVRITRRWFQPEQVSLLASDGRVIPLHGTTGGVAVVCP